MTWRRSRLSGVSRATCAFETTLFENAFPHMDSFAQDRLQQGVPVFGKGPINQIRLQPPTADEIKVLVDAREFSSMALDPNHNWQDQKKTQARGSSDNRREITLI